MFGPSSGMGYRVPPRRIANIRAHALAVRDMLVAHSAPFFRMEPFIEGLLEYGIIYDVVDEGELPFGIEACCVPERLLMTFLNSTYEKACKDDPRARFTVIHELGHILMAHTRPHNRDSGGEIAAYEDSEWQANQFAAEFLMPLSHITMNGYKTTEELILNYQVSYPAAERRIAQLNKRNELPRNG